MMKNSKVESHKRGKRSFFFIFLNIIRANRNIEFRSIDIWNTFVICVSDRLTANVVVNSIDFLTRRALATRRAALTLASVKKAEELRDLSCRRRRCHPRVGHSVSAKKRVDFPRRRLPPLLTSFDRSKRCARSFNGTYFYDRASGRIFLSATFSRKFPT